MTIIFNGFHEVPYFPIINMVLEIYGPDKCHIIFQQDMIAPTRAVNAIYYPCAVLSHDVHYEMDMNKLTPLDACTINQMADCEAVCLKMMDRDEVFGPLSYSKRKATYLKHLRYWNHVIDTDKVSLFITSNIPHVVYDYIIYNFLKQASHS